MVAYEISLLTVSAPMIERARVLITDFSDKYISHYFPTLPGNLNRRMVYIIACIHHIRAIGVMAPTLLNPIK